METEVECAGPAAASRATRSKAGVFTQRVP
jgi:hypothetical protein